MKSAFIQLIDLRSITRHSDSCETVVTLIDPYKGNPEERSIEWIKLGESTLHLGSELKWLSAYLNGGMTDFEEDSAYAIRLPLVGVEFEGMMYGVSTFTAVIDPRGESDFHVPDPGYNPADLPGAKLCVACEKPHIIVPGGYYVPPVNSNLFRSVAGMRVRITVGHPYKDDAKDSA